MNKLVLPVAVAAFAGFLAGGSLDAPADATPTVQTAEPDSDGDGWTDTLELHVGTIPTLPGGYCAATPAKHDEDLDATPPDLLIFGPVLFSSYPNPNYRQRYDLDMDYRIGLTDALKFIRIFNAPACVP